VRSRVALGAVIALMLVVIALGARAVRENVREARRVQLAKVLRRVPPNFSVVGPANREYRHAADREALAALLDEAAEVALEPLPTLLLRASFRQDHGDPDGAASDFRSIADFVGTPLAREIAARYTAAAAERGDVRGSKALNLDDLPQSTSPTDRYLLGYHLTRAGKEKEAMKLLSDPEVRSIPHAEELFLASTDFESLPKMEQRRLAVERYADVVRLEERLGARTATTAHLAAWMLVVQSRHDEALRLCAEGIALAPRAYLIQLNAGYCAFVLGRIDEARERLTVARDLRPNYAKIIEQLMWLEIAEGHFDAAAELGRDAGPHLVPAQTVWVDQWTGVVATYAALDAHAVRDVAERGRQLTVALACFERVFDAGSKPNEAVYSIAQALEKDDGNALLLAVVHLVVKEPNNWWRQLLLRRHLPTKLDASETAAVLRVLEALDTRAFK
jgi:tetratricopeptide (TPR) repeat protein